MLRNDLIRDLDPLTPELATIFTGDAVNSLDPVFNMYLDAQASADLEPDASVCADAARPLVFYQLEDCQYPLRLVKQPGCRIATHYF